MYIVLKEPPQSVHYAQDYVLSGPRQRSTIFRFNIFYHCGGGGGKALHTLKTAYLEMALPYFWPTGNLTLFIWECFFDLVLLRNGEFYSVDTIYGCLSSHAIAGL